MQVDPNILRAERLRAIISMPEYHATIGAWLEEGLKEALHNLATAVDVHDVHRAQGGYKVMYAFKENFDRVFQLEEAAIDKKLKKTNRALGAK